MDHLEPQSPEIDEEAELLAAHSRRKFLGIAGAVIVGGAGLAACAQDGATTVAAQAGEGTTTSTAASTTTTARTAAQVAGEDGLTAQAIALEPRSGTGPFVRMFNANEINTGELSERADALIELSQPGSILDANEEVDAGAVALLNQPELSALNPDNPTMNAGATFFGQFLDHDLTLDVGSRLGRPTRLARSTNLRSVRLDLDSVYGGGPNQSPNLYDDNFRFIVESGGLYEDVPRDNQGAAIIGDDRNDENLIVSGLHAAFLLFHNNVMNAVEESGLTGVDAFLQARQLVRWHYQWITLHEFLPMVVGQEMVDDVLTNGRQFYTTNVPQMPVEFQTSAYRFGHSLVRASYQANSSGDDGNPFIAMVFDMTLPESDDPDDLRGGHRAPRRYIDWESFFDFEGVQTADRAKMIDTKVTSPLFRLPSIAISTGRDLDPQQTSLATRNLLRHLTWEVATGQQAAAQMGIEPLAASDLALFDDFGTNLSDQTPLWLYVLQEAAVLNGGTHLGPIGGRIVAEVFIGLLEMDSASFLSADPTWIPTLRTYGDPTSFNMADLLTAAGVDPRSRRT